MDNNALVAHYDLEQEYTPRMYEASGHNLMVLEDYSQIAIGGSIQLIYLFPSYGLTNPFFSEIIASFLIMRHIKLFNL